MTSGSPSNEQSASGLAAVYLENRASLLRLLIARTRDPAAAEELLQDLWFRLRDAASGPIANPAGYLHRAALNLANDRARADRQRLRREADWVDATTVQRGGIAVEDTPAADALLEGKRRAARLAAAIGRLPPGAARVFRRHKLDGLSHAEVAAELGITKSAVEKHMAVALRHLVREMGAEALGPR